MNFTETLIFVTGLLYLEKRVSCRRIRRDLDLDDETLDELRYELVKVRRIADEEAGGVLVWAGPDGAQPAPSRAAGKPAGEQSGAHADEREQSGEQRQAGQKIPPGGDAARRQLTVMFCDLQGSTELATRIDPEDLRDIIARFQDACRAAIESYEGFVARYMGDGILVYFGYPKAHEDDPARAVRAGLDIVAAMAGLNAELGGLHEVDLRVRIGVATGPVVVGDLIGEGAAEEAAVVGETPNLAARLQGVAQSNQVMVDPVAHRLLSNRFDFEDAGKHSLKGIAQPVQAWRALSERDPDEAHENFQVQAAPPLVGRQEELGLLLRSWEASKSGHGQVVTIQGEAGIGKSRLFEALRAHIGNDAHLSVVVRCSPYHTHSSLYPVIVHMRRVMGWDHDDDNETRLAKLESVLERQKFELAEAVPLFSDLLSLPLPDDRYAPLGLSAKQQREQTLDILSGWLFDEAEKSPVLQVWEDLHWADPTTLEYLGMYIEQSPTVPMLNVLTYRPEFVPPWPMRSHMTPITLNRLERGEIEALIGNQAGGKPVPAEVIEHVVEKSDGVPLYVEELTKTILESDYIREEKDRYVLTGALSDVSVPTTLNDSLMARLDRAPMAREVAQLGAVLGREFAYEMLHSLSSLEEPVLRQGLDELVGNELLYQRGRPPRARFIFKHALIHDAAYQSLLRRTRQQYHREVARLLEERFQETVAADPELLAHHYTEAGEMERGVRYWLAAGDRARGLSANWEALGHLEKGLEVLRQLPESKQRAHLELALQVSLGGANIVARGHAAREVEAAYGRARELCRQLGDVPEILSSVFGLWRFFIVCRHNEQVLDIAEQLMQLSKEREDDVHFVIAHYAKGFTELVLGRLEAARDDMNKAIARYRPDQRSADIYRAAHDPGTACLAYLSNCEWLLGRPARARDRLRESLALAERIGDAVSLAHALSFCTITSEMLNDDAETEAMAERTLTVSLDKGFAAWIAVGRITRTWISVKLGRGEGTVEKLRQEIAAFGDLGYDILQPYFLSLLARAYRQKGQPDRAMESLDRAQKISDSRMERWWQPEILRLRGELWGDDPVRGGEQFTRSLELAREQRSRALELRAAMSLGRLWQRQDRREEALHLLRPVYDAFREGLDTHDLTEARILLASLRS